jgi:hypothetical protein
MLLGVVGVIVLFGTIIAVAVALNHYSGQAMDQIDESKPVSHSIGWALLWFGLAAVAALVAVYAMSTANTASQSSQPPPSSYQPSPQENSRSIGLAR